MTDELASAADCIIVPKIVPKEGPGGDDGRSMRCGAALLEPSGSVTRVRVGLPRLGGGTVVVRQAKSRVARADGAGRRVINYCSSAHMTDRTCQEPAGNPWPPRACEPTPSHDGRAPSGRALGWGGSVRTEDGVCMEVGRYVGMYVGMYVNMYVVKYVSI